MGSFRSLAELVSWLRTAPLGTSLPAASVLAAIEPLADLPEQEVPSQSREAGGDWRERLWTAPPQTRIGVKDLAEAMGRPKSWIYRHTAPGSQLPPLPHRKLDGGLVFVVGEIRSWLESHETRLVGPLRVLSNRAATRR